MLLCHCFYFDRKSIVFITENSSKTNSQFFFLVHKKTQKKRILWQNLPPCKYIYFCCTSMTAHCISLCCSKSPKKPNKKYYFNILKQNIQPIIERKNTYFPLGLYRPNLLLEKSFKAFFNNLQEKIMCEPQKCFSSSLGKVTLKKSPRVKRA